MPVAPGQNLLHYRLVDKLGEGGMGVVWRALDTTLDRETAIKVLPECVAADSERLARFEREAKLLAALNHPNIAAVYGLDEADGVRFLVMELVPGEDLARSRLASAALSRWTRRSTIAHCRSARGAGSGARKRRDPPRSQAGQRRASPPDGQVKVLDFGLAKAAFGRAAWIVRGQSLSPTLTSAGNRGRRRSSARRPT